MTATFESILPVFLLILVGNLLRRTPVFDDATWPGLEKLGFWFLYPTLLFITIAEADFRGLALDVMMIALAAAIVTMCAILFVCWKVFGAAGLVSAGQFSSIFQTSLRWNGFMAFAIAEKIFPPEGIAVVALVMAVIIIPINLASIFVLARFSDQGARWGNVLWKVVTNPLILASLAAVLVRLVPGGLYAPLAETLDLVGRAALGMGLVVIGAGLKPGDLVRPGFATVLPVVLKLAVFPALLLGIAMALGLDGMQLQYLALCAAVPTALNGYLLARQMGGDAELYAAVTTLQTVASFVSIPAVLAISAQFAG
ncbi:MAG: AEC family transporter [Rhizobiaceae bacterium]|nr:MAG: AEC family transporter [Rhizobiaceae bacterium]CAG1011073.1 hypothetical protein RHIZO_03914 [Rhizobiaceae bacterium]